MNIQAQKLELVELILGINNAKALKQLKAAIQEAVDFTPSDESPRATKKYKDDTEYLLSTEANRESLRRSLEQSERGEGRRVKLEHLWK